MKAQKILLISLCCLLGFTLLIAVFPQIWNVDIFWHMATGRWILESGALPSTDVFSAITPEREWHPFQWLYEVIVSLLDDSFGLGSLRLLTGILLLITSTILIVQLRSRGFSPWAIVALLALTWVLFGDRIRVRPHVFNFFFVALYLRLLWKRPQEISLKSDLLKLLPGIALWANLHAGGLLIFLVMLGTLPGGATVEYLMAKKRSRLTSTHPVCTSWALWCAAAITAALMPNFVVGTLHVPNLLEDSQSLITEWNNAWSWVTLGLSHLETNSQVIPAMFLVGLTPWFCLLLSVAVAAFMLMKPQEERPLSFSGFFLTIGVSLIATQYGRFAWLCIIPLSVLMKPLSPYFKPMYKVIPIAALAFSLAVSHYQIQTIRGGVEPAFDTLLGDHLDERRFPTQGAHFLNTASIQGKAWALPNWGGYLLWACKGDILVLSDGRGNYGAETAQHLTHIYEHRWKLEALSETVEAYNAYPGIDLIVIQHPALPNGEELDGWTRIFPPSHEWISELGLPPQMGQPVKEVIYAKNESMESLQKAKDTWRKVAERLVSSAQ